MKKPFLTLIFLFLLVSPLKSNDYPNIAVVQTDADHQMLMGVTEKAAAQIFYTMYPDVFDFLIFYTTFNPTLNMQQGLPIQYTIEGIGREGAVNPYGPASAWGSGGKLIGGAKMCHIDKYPDNPDDTMAFPLSGLSSVELLAHEMGHYWHAAMNFRKEGMNEDHTGLRGFESDSANQHWNGDFMSGPSVMYGADITDNGDGTFTYTPGNPRKFGPLDMYSMGFLPPEEVGELFFLCGSADINQCKEGNPQLPTAKKSDPWNRSDVVKHVVTIEDIIRAMGERKPSSAESQKHFNVGFIMVNKPGFLPFPQQLEKLDKIRKRYQEWFHWATDGKATICTELDGDCENSEEPDDETVDENNPLVDETVEIPDETTESPDEAKDEEIQDDAETIDNSVPAKDDISETTDDSGDNFIEDESTGCGCTVVF
jgi:large repetitive protein